MTPPMQIMRNLSTLWVTFVLVHGAWHKGCCWKKLAPLLRPASHEAFAQTLTGMGKRSHLFTSDTDLESHDKDVTAAIDYENIDSVVLVGLT